MADVDRRAAMTAQRFGQMRHIWTRKTLHIRHTTAATTVHRERVLHDDLRVRGVLPGR